MKDKSYILISLVVLVFGIWAVPKIVDRFKAPDLFDAGVAPSFELTDQNNKKITNKDYEGKVYVVEFFFANCPTICPIMNSNMMKLQEEFFGNLKFGVASITIDPERDTVEALKAHADGLGVKLPFWHMMTGDREYIYALAKKFNIYAGKNAAAEGGFEHSGLFALIDKKGHIRSRMDEQGNPIFYYDGTNDEDVKKIKEDIKLLLEE
ncbi:MAG: SCO family protein [Flavobacteriaceae bacterium]|jgi:protein SCO1/2|nr:SCO family protein [Flavobacteriaceae bacterium]